MVKAVLKVKTPAGAQSSNQTLATEKQVSTGRWAMEQAQLNEASQASGQAQHRDEELITLSTDTPAVNKSTTSSSLDQSPDNVSRKYANELRTLSIDTSTVNNSIATPSHTTSASVLRRPASIAHIVMTPPADLMSFDDGEGS